MFAVWSSNGPPHSATVDDYKQALPNPVSPLVRPEPDAEALKTKWS